MLAAARHNNRVVQVGLQRRSTPHLVEAKERFIEEGKLGKIALVEIYCYYHMRATANPPDTAPPANLDYDAWTGPAPMRPYNSLVHPRGWRAFMEYGNGIVGDMCVHMLDMTRWMLGLGWPTKTDSTGGIFVDKKSKANISDTQTATFDFQDLRVVWQHRSWGEAADPKYPWGATFYGDKGTLKVSVMGYDFIPVGGGQPVHKDVTYELEQYPEDKTEKGDSRNTSRPPSGIICRTFLPRSTRVAIRSPTSSKGYISTWRRAFWRTTRMKLGRSLAWDPEKQARGPDIPRQTHCYAGNIERLTRIPKLRTDLQSRF